MTDKLEHIVAIQLQKVQKEKTEKLRSYISTISKSATPIDTGNLKASWKQTGIQNINNTYKFSIVNSADYARFVLWGRRYSQEAKRMVGSNQMPDPLTDIIKMQLEKLGGQI
jgi:hypothetical protein